MSGRPTHDSQILARPRSLRPPLLSPVPLLQILSRTGKTSHTQQIPHNAPVMPKCLHPSLPHHNTASLSSNTNGATSWSASSWRYLHARTLAESSPSSPIQAWTTPCEHRYSRTNCAPRASPSQWHILHRAHRAHSAHTHLSFPASARTSALAGSSFLLVTTLRIPMVCLASASVWRSITPLAETSPALPPHVVSHVFNQLGREACSVTSPRASRCSEATQPVTGWCTQTEVNNITTGKGNTWWSDYRCLDLRIASCATLNLSAAHCHRHILYYKISVPRDRPTARTRGRV